MPRPQIPRAALVALDAASGKVLQVIELQYNPDTLVNDFEVRPATPAAEGEAAGPPIHKITFHADFDATDALEHPEQNPTVAQFGLWPQLAAIECLLYAPRSEGVAQTPAEEPLIVLVCGSQRVLPVAITQLTVTEQAFDAGLNPIRASVSVQLRVLSSDDTPPESPARSFATAAQQRLARLAALVPSVSPPPLGLEASG
jgi:hypothetical protein